MKFVKLTKALPVTLFFRLTKDQKITGTKINFIKYLEDMLSTAEKLHEKMNQNYWRPVKIED